MVVAGGMESMSNCPYLLPRVREGMRLGHGEAVDSMIFDGLWDAYEDYHMGCTGEVVAEKYGVTRAAAGRMGARQPPQGDRRDPGGPLRGRDPAVLLPQKKGDPVPFAVDESPREDTSLEALARLKPAFKDGRYRDRGQRARRERRRGGAGGRVRPRPRRPSAGSPWPASSARPCPASSRRW